MALRLSSAVELGLIEVRAEKQLDRLRSDRPFNDGGYW